MGLKSYREDSCATSHLMLGVKEGQRAMGGYGRGIYPRMCGQKNEVKENFMHINNRPIF